jgi:hypothetical protein
MASARKAALVAFAAVLGLWLWQFLTVHYNYGGNWTALFRIRAGMPVPEFLKSEKLYIFTGDGYDGQVYHLIAHDPWMQKGSREAIEGASFRYQRIFVPALAWMVALGNDSRIHAAYFAVILGFAFLGVWWMALIAARVGLSELWGLAFLVIPAAITSIDRMTVDIALAALLAGFALYAGKVPAWRVAILLGCAALTRETALPVIAGYALYLVTRREIGSAVWIAASAVPAIAWFAYLERVEPSPVGSYGGWIPFAGFVERLVHPATYSGEAWKAAVAMGCDYVALAGVAIVLVATLRFTLRRRWDPVAAAMYCLAIAVVFLKSRGVWEEANAFGRVLSPLVLLVAVQRFRKPWVAIAPALMLDAPIALTIWAQVAGVARGLFR